MTVPGAPFEGSPGEALLAGVCPYCMGTKRVRLTEPVDDEYPCAPCGGTGHMTRPLSLEGGGIDATVFPDGHGGGHVVLGVRRGQQRWRKCSIAFWGVNSGVDLVLLVAPMSGLAKAWDAVMLVASALMLRHWLSPRRMAKYGPI